MNLEDLLAHYPAIKGTRLNMVTTKTLQFTGDSGSSREISSQDDRTLLVHLRKLAGLIVTDAATAHAESYRPSKWAPIEVWSQSGDFRGFAEVKEDDAHKSMSLIQPAELTSAVAERVATRGSVLFETGPTLSKALGSLDLIDEFCLTVSACDDKHQANHVVEQVCEKLALDHLKVNNADIFNANAYLRLTR